MLAEISAVDPAIHLSLLTRRQTAGPLCRGLAFSAVSSTPASTLR
jgi:hypothetical protein